MALHSDEFIVSDEPSTRLAALDALCARAMSYQLAGEFVRAEQIYREILDTEPQHAAANYCIGMLLLQSKQPAECLPHLLAALAAQPQIADYWLGYLEALLVTGDTEQASSTFALARQHGLSGPGADDFAARLSVKSLALAEALETELLADVTARNFTRARPSARVLTQRFPHRGVGWKVLGALLATDEPTDEALSALQQAARLLPGDAETLCNLGVIFIKLKRFEEAESALQNAIAIDPGLNQSYIHLGFVQAARGKLSEAEAMYRHAIAAGKPDTHSPTDMILRSSLLFLLSHNPLVDAPELFAEHLAIGRWFERSTGPDLPRFSNARDPERRLRVGFVSGDFRDHALANFFEPTLEELRNNRSLELHAFYNFESEDDVSRRIRGHFKKWHSVSALTDLELVKLIKTSRIDILIDMSSHTFCGRLRVFALRAAPIQVSWLGYPGTTGLRAMDYYLADRYFLPPGRFDDSFTEKIAYLPASPSFRSHADAPPVNRLPALDAGFVTFGSFNRPGKVNPFTVRLWSRLLREVPSSIMVMGAIPVDERRRELTELFNAEGVVTERLAFIPRQHVPQYLASHHDIDLCLDTFPYTGGTTTNHALWMGVPTLTLTGRTPASRQGAALLGPLGLEGFVADNPDDFVNQGLHWSRELPALAEVRSGLRQRWLESSLHRPAIIAAGFDGALRHMWRRWCADLPTESF